MRSGGEIHREREIDRGRERGLSSSPCAQCPVCIPTPPLSHGGTITTHSAMVASTEVGLFSGGGRHAGAFVQLKDKPLRLLRTPWGWVQAWCYPLEAQSRGPGHQPCGSNGVYWHNCTRTAIWVDIQYSACCCAGHWCGEEGPELMRAFSVAPWLQTLLIGTRVPSVAQARL